MLRLLQLVLQLLGLALCLPGTLLGGGGGALRFLHELRCTCYRFCCCFLELTSLLPIRTVVLHLA